MNPMILLHDTRMMEHCRTNLPFDFAPKGQVFLFKNGDGIVDTRIVLSKPKTEIRTLYVSKSYSHLEPVHSVNSALIYLHGGIKYLIELLQIPFLSAKDQLLFRLLLRQRFTLLCKGSCSYTVNVNFLRTIENLSFGRLMCTIASYLIRCRCFEWLSHALLSAPGGSRQSLKHVVRPAHDSLVRSQAENIRKSVSLKMLGFPNRFHPWLPLSCLAHH